MKGAGHDHETEMEHNKPKDFCPPYCPSQSLTTVIPGASKAGQGPQTSFWGEGNAGQFRYFKRCVAPLDA